MSHQWPLQARTKHKSALISFRGIAQRILLRIVHQSEEYIFVYLMGNVSSINIEFLWTGLQSYQGRTQSSLSLYWLRFQRFSLVDWISSSSQILRTFLILLDSQLELFWLRILRLILGNRRDVYSIEFCPLEGLVFEIELIRKLAIYFYDSLDFAHYS